MGVYKQGESRKRRKSMFNLSNEEALELDSILSTCKVTPIQYEKGAHTKKDCGSDCKGKCGASCQAVCKSTCSALF